jgi:hypothetical protein
MIDQQFASTVDYFDAEIARSFYSFDVRLEFPFCVFAWGFSFYSPSRRTGFGSFILA